MIAYEAAHGAIGRLRRLGATARLFEAAVQQHIIQPQTLGVSFIRISGLTLEHCANGFMRSGVAALFTMGGHHWIIEGNTVRQVNSVGIDAGGRGSVRHQTAGLPRNPGAEQSRCAHPGRRCHLIAGFRQPELACLADTDNAVVAHNFFARVSEELVASKVATDRSLNGRKLTSTGNRVVKTSGLFVKARESTK